MSQVGSFGVGVVPPAGFVATLTGNDLVAVPPTAENINIVGNSLGTLFVSGDIGTSTLTITDQNTGLFTVTTTNDIPTTIATISVPALSAIVVDVLVVGAKLPIFSASINAKMIVGAHNSGSGVTVVATPQISYSLDSLSGSPTVSAFGSGNNLLITVAGESAITYNWTAYIRYLLQT